jgi:hypothetical protein
VLISLYVMLIGLAALLILRLTKAAKDWIELISPKTIDIGIFTAANLNTLSSLFN